MMYRPTREDFDRINAGFPWDDEYRAHQLGKAFSYCNCGHYRARHIGCKEHDECCDEENCQCDGYKSSLTGAPG